MLWIALHLPALSLEAFAATLEPAQAAGPAALVEAHHIVQANAAARALGVQSGLKRATALALAPDLLLGQADAWRDAQALTAVAHAALAFRPAGSQASAAPRWPLFRACSSAHNTSRPRTTSQWPASMPICPSAQPHSAPGGSNSITLWRAGASPPGRGAATAAR